VVSNGGSGGGEALYTMPSECEVCFVIEGEVHLDLGDEQFDLGPGDALTFGAAVPHTWRSSGEARILWILAPGLPDPRKEVS
jgi:mannose-6-phosphate isomerase-like protein (cupin superfamily)